MTNVLNAAEITACTPIPVNKEAFNKKAEIPYGLKVEHICRAMEAWSEFLGFVNVQLNSKKILRMETMLMQANFSSMVGEFMTATIPKHCSGLKKNRYHNGHPDMLPAGMYDRDSMQHCDQGIEVKGSRRTSGWQGHNAESCWLMVFQFDSNTPVDVAEQNPPRPFRFVRVLLAKLDMGQDWKFSGRNEGSRRTITASVTRTGYDKMVANWIYNDPLPKTKRPSKSK